VDPFSGEFVAEVQVQEGLAELAVHEDCVVWVFWK